MPPAPSPGLYAHTRPHDRQHMTSGPGSRPGQRSTRNQIHQDAAPVPPIRTGESWKFSQLAADHAGKAGPEAIRTHAHTPAGQRNTSPGIQATHTPAQSAAARHRQQDRQHIPTAAPGSAGQRHTRQNPNASAQASRKRGIFHTPRTHARINSPAHARERYCARGILSLRVAAPKIFVGLGPKNHFPRT